MILIRIFSYREQITDELTIACSILLSMATMLVPEALKERRQKELD